MHLVDGSEDRRSVRDIRGVHIYDMYIYICMISGQIIATSHDLGPQKVAEERKSPAISGNSRLVKYYFIWPDVIFSLLLMAWMGLAGKLIVEMPTLDFWAQVQKFHRWDPN